jgi:hypothetical protein
MRPVTCHRERTVLPAGLPAGIVVALALVLLASCAPPWPRWGALAIRIEEPQPKTIVPGIDMTITGYEIFGTGPGGAQFSRSGTGSELTVSGLAFGAWAVSVEGRNAAGLHIAHGEAVVEVITGTTQSVNIAVSPIAGFGALGLEVSWPAADVGSPSVHGQLLPAQGPAIDLAFSAPAGGRATSSTSALQNGYYTLVVSLLDNGLPVMGAVDVVRIVSGQTTSGTIAFSGVNAGSGSILVSIAPDMREPIPVVMTGQVNELATATAMTVAVSVPAGLDNATFVWYVNGVAAATGGELTVNTTSQPLAAGVYRLDVTAFTAGGTRAGSATHTLQVVGTGYVTLEWDANTEPNLAGYRIYVGTASGSYGTIPIEAGLATTCTVGKLTNGRTYYFVATAFDTSGVESGRSNEVSCTVP